MAGQFGTSYQSQAAFPKVPGRPNAAQNLVDLGFRRAEQQPMTFNEAYNALPQPDPIPQGNYPNPFQEIGFDFNKQLGARSAMDMAEELYRGYLSANPGHVGLPNSARENARQASDARTKIIQDQHRAALTDAYAPSAVAWAGTTMQDRLSRDLARSGQQLDLASLANQLLATSSQASQGYLGTLAGLLRPQAATRFPPGAATAGYWPSRLSTLPLGHRRV